MIQYKYKEAIVMYEENELDSTCGVSDDELTKRFVKAIRINNEIGRAGRICIFFVILHNYFAYNGRER